MKWLEYCWTVGLSSEFKGSRSMLIRPLRLPSGRTVTPRMSWSSGSAALSCFQTTSHRWVEAQNPTRGSVLGSAGAAAAEISNSEPETAAWPMLTVTNRPMMREAPPPLGISCQTTRNWPVEDLATLGFVELSAEASTSTGAWGRVRLGPTMRARMSLLLPAETRRKTDRYVLVCGL
jgi:hypothetical protein